jgi:hypothetical protein
MEYPYNAIIGRGTLNAFEAIHHPAYLCMKIPSYQGPIAAHRTQEAPRRAKGNWTGSKAIHNIDEVKAHQQYKHKRDKVVSADQSKPMLLCEDIAEQKVLLGSQLSDEQEKTLLRFLFNNKDVFAWLANDLCGVNRDVIEDSLNVDPAIRPRKQRLRKMSDDKVKGARNEVKRLLSAGVIRDVTYLEWLANTVMVKKDNGKWRMCIDFIDLNKACPKDEFPLPSRLYGGCRSYFRANEPIGLLLRLPSNLDEERRRAQDKLHNPQWNLLLPSDARGAQECWRKLQQETAKVLHSKIGKNVLTYVDDIIVKSTKQENHIADWQETFANFRRAGLKLNPEKCVFEVKKGKFLGCLVSTNGIEANPRKIRSYTSDGATEVTKRCLEVDRKAGINE